MLKPSYLVCVRLHPVEDRVEATVAVSLALNLPCAISKYSHGGSSTPKLDVLRLHSQGGSVHKDAEMINARHALVIEVVVQVLAEVKASHDVDQSKACRLWWPRESGARARWPRESRASAEPAAVMEASHIAWQETVSRWHQTKPVARNCSSLA